MKRVWIKILCCFLLLQVTGCSTTQAETGFTIVDQAGRSVTFDKPAKQR